MSGMYESILDSAWRVESVSVVINVHLDLVMENDVERRRCRGPASAAVPQNSGANVEPVGYLNFESVNHYILLTTWSITHL
ncbi:MAG TPA: hypothetical protein VN577_05030 [Terriglobales bacterium]|nr:hypothetical protein [Terriglobales bacterium]